MDLISDQFAVIVSDITPISVNKCPETIAAKATLQLEQYAFCVLHHILVVVNM